MRPQRGGTTLMEVLISIMIMAIGVIGVATLFPISLIHAVKAHQLTSGTIHRFNAEALLDVRPELANPNLFLVGPAAPPPSIPYLVDPLGVVEGMPNTVGTISRLSPYSPYPPDVERQLAELTTTQQDSWDGLFTSAVTDWTDISNPTNPSCQVENLGTSGIVVNNTGTPPPDYVAPYPRTQAVLFYDDPITQRRRSFVRNVWRVQPGSDTLELVRPVNLPIDPSTGNPVPLGEVRIQTQIRHFTWILTVRPDVTLTPAVGDVDLVVFFKRSFEAAEDEALYHAWFLNGDDEASIRWNANTQPEPSLKRGSYVLDSNNGRWYRIIDYSRPQPSSMPGFTHEASLTLLSSAMADSSPVGGAGNAVLMRGIVDVYPLNPRVLE